MKRRTTDCFYFVIRKIIEFLVLGMFLLLLFGILCERGVYCKEDNDSMAIANTYYLKGKEFLLKGEYQKADEAFKKAEEILNKKSSKKKERLSLRKSDSKRRKISSKISPSNLEAERRKIETILEAAKQAYFEGNLELALRLYARVLRKYPTDADLYYNLGVIYLKKADYLSAAEEFKRAILLDPSDADAYYNLGVIYENFLNDKEKAISHYQSYLKLCTSEEEKREIKRWIERLRREVR
ncbi:MAG: tetratricopeptide repeat protein [Candidatus Omnitrophica bacterium]|nr:tetratricopeptide repeat protein [Candidatus Omnitrophota bacterium]